VAWRYIDITLQKHMQLSYHSPCFLSNFGNHRELGLLLVWEDFSIEWMVRSTCDLWGGPVRSRGTCSLAQIIPRKAEKPARNDEQNQDIHLAHPNFETPTSARAQLTLRTICERVCPPQSKSQAFPPSIT